MANLMASKVVVVTGGASGIGRATAVAFARESARVVIGDIDSAGAEKAVASISNNGGEASYVRVDVTKPADVQQMIISAVTQYGGLDYAFNNAGLVGSNAGVVETSEEDWHRVMAINLMGVWLCMKYEIPEMLKRGGGAIVNNGSAVGNPFGGGGQKKVRFLLVLAIHRTSGAVTYTSTSDTPSPYCGILMSDRDGRDRLRGRA
jgi:NAD(P)-dependent dehydrogenase (short-subunit alcohol dehydrogenase family)